MTRPRRRRRTRSLIADERHVARRIGELVRADRRERHDRARRAHAAGRMRTRSPSLAAQRGGRGDRRRRAAAGSTASPRTDTGRRSSSPPRAQPARIGAPCIVDEQRARVAADGARCRAAASARASGADAPTAARRNPRKSRRFIGARLSAIDQLAHVRGSAAAERGQRIAAFERRHDAARRVALRRRRSARASPTRSRSR